LRDMELLSGPAQESAGRITAHLTAARPWVDILTLQPELEIVRQTYREERARLLEWQGQRAEQARANIRSRDGYSTLPADKAHNVIRPINEATTDTTADAISPALRDLRDSFIVRLQAAEERANRTLDEYRNTDSKHPFVPINLGLQNREVKSEAEVDALIAEIRERLLQQLRNGQRIRLL